MVDMKNKMNIPIWEHCDPTVSAAIRQFEERWQPYSQSSQRHPIVGLIKDVIDPAVAAYVRNLPEGFTGFIPGAGSGVAFSKIIRLVGLGAMLREQRQLLRQFIMTEDQQTARDQCFVATLESLIELVLACMCKRSAEIIICEPCAPGVSAAIERFEMCWGRYSQSSRRYNIVRLIEEVIDPALSTYIGNLPVSYTGFLVGSGPGLGFSSIIRLVGLEEMIRLQRQLLRQFIMTQDQQTARDQSFIATLESLIELALACICKRPQSSSATKGVNLNDQRRHGYCEHCGQLTEFAAFMSTVAEAQVNDAELEEQKKLELSDKYCVGHKPKLATGEWNPSYRQAKRSLTQFNIELARLTRQCAKRSEGGAKSGDKLIDEYFYHFMLNLTIQPADHAELRNLARRVVDSKLSDTKKKMLALQKLGFNQTEIGQRLLNASHQPMTRQAVSKALAAVQEKFRL